MGSNPSRLILPSKQALLHLEVGVFHEVRLQCDVSRGDTRRHRFIATDSGMGARHAILAHMVRVLT